MVLNEVYTGAGLSATMIPEIEFNLSDAFGSNINSTGNFCLATTDSQKSITWTLTSEPASNRLVTDIYKGCFAKVDKFNSAGADQATSQTLIITGNTANKIQFNAALSATASDVYKCTILAYGTPLYAPSVVNSTATLLADNWLGLVNTITPPTIDAEMKQLNLALGGTRNFGFQLKGAETLGEASIDVSLNNGSWLYYALGKMTFTATTGGDDLTDGASNGDVYYHDANSQIYRYETSLLPPIVRSQNQNTYKKWDEGKIVYTITEQNSGDLPSFALEITNEKGNTTYAADSEYDNHFSRIFTGCQVNSFSMSFEEGQDVKASIGAVSRKAHNAPAAYIPKRNVTTPSSLFNYSDTDTNNPYMFSDGTIKIFGQTMARIKSGTLTINNNLMPQRFIGNYDRTITSTHIAGQRTYDLQLSLLITDRTIWDELRKKNETSDTDSTDELIELEFAKSDDDKIVLKFDNYLTTSVDIPFPDDKGPLEVAVSVSPRTLNLCEYHGKWIIQG
jgi:hypothetical protein